MMIRQTLALLTLLTLAGSAQALKLSVWDRELQTKLGDGESSGGKFNVRLVGNYSGPVVVLFAQTEDEKARNAFPGLKSRYNGILDDGQLTLQVLPVVTAQAADRSAAGNVAATSGAPNSAVTLSRFLAGFKFSLNLQPAGQSLSLPGLKPGDGNK